MHSHTFEHVFLSFSLYWPSHRDVFLFNLIKWKKSIYLAQGLALSNGLNESSIPVPARHSSPLEAVSYGFMESLGFSWGSVQIRVHFPEMLTTGLYAPRNTLCQA